MPQKGKSPKIFYGWWIVIDCFAIAIMTSGLVVYGFTAFFDPIIEEFGWSYAAVSLAVSLRGVETGLISPVLGFLVDRWGAKWILFTGTLLTGLGLIILSRVTSLAQFYGAFIVVAISTSFCGPGVVNPVINHWFRRNLGKATGILAAGFALGGLLVPVIIKLIDSYGWREALVILGVCCLVICVPLALIIRHKPEQHGSMPDGDIGSLDNKSINIKNPELDLIPAEINMGVSQVLKSRTFWHITLAFALQYLVISAVLVHIMPFLNTVGIPRSTASFFAGAIPVFSVIGRLGSGWLSDKFSSKRVAVVSFAFVCLGTLLFDYVTSITLWILVLAVILFSVSYGCANTLRAVLPREYFGKSRFATVFGFLLGILALGSMLGPYLAGWTFDIWKSYHYAWILFTGVNLASLVLIATTPSVRVKDSAKA